MVSLTREQIILVELVLRSVSYSLGVIAPSASSKLVALAWSQRILHAWGGNALVFGALGTTAYWQGQVFAVVWIVCILPTLFQIQTHPALRRRRAPMVGVAEKDARQRLIVALLALGMLALLVVSLVSGGLDSQLGVSSVPVPAVLFGDLLVASGLLLVWLVFRVNAYAASTVTVEPEQPVISTGPYALVRHPMYSGWLLLMLGVPVALGSWWGLVLFPPLLLVTIWRLTNEETYLCTHLPGYQDYCARVTHRLIPFIW
jgi:protein-S-isoprenylcysteine O-methyltransferase Ste14